MMPYFRKYCYFLGKEQFRLFFKITKTLFWEEGGVFSYQRHHGILVGILGFLFKAVLVEISVSQNGHFCQSRGLGHVLVGTQAGLQPAAFLIL